MAIHESALCIACGKRWRRGTGELLCRACDWTARVLPILVLVFACAAGGAR